jgi:hypothetical protein
MSCREADRDQRFCGPTISKTASISALSVSSPDSTGGPALMLEAERTTEPARQKTGESDDLRFMDR